MEISRLPQLKNKNFLESQICRFTKVKNIIDNIEDENYNKFDQIELIKKTNLLEQKKKNYLNNKSHLISLKSYFHKNKKNVVKKVAKTAAFVGVGVGMTATNSGVITFSKAFCCGISISDVSFGSGAHKTKTPIKKAGIRQFNTVFVCFAAIRNMPPDDYAEMVQLGSPTQLRLNQPCFPSDCRIISSTTIS